MIARVLKPATCDDSVNYLLGKPGAQLIASTMTGSSPRDYVAELEASAAAAVSRHIKNPYFHGMLRVAPGESLTVEQWREISERFMIGMGFTDNMYLAVLHTDSNQPHVHFFASRVRDTTGRLVSDSWDFRRAMDLARRFEAEYGLRVVPFPPERRTIPGPLDEESAHRYLRAAIEQAAAGSPTVSELIERLADRGVEVRANVAHSGRVSGISFAYGSHLAKGSTLGRAFSWAGLQERLGVRYEPETDLQTLVRHRLTVPSDDAPAVASAPAEARPARASAPAPEPLHEIARPRPVTAPGPELERAVADHLSALPSARYKVLVVTEGEAPLARTWSREQVLSALGFLKHHNDRGAEILFRCEPSWAVVRLDRLTANELERAHRAGYQAAAAVESAPGRFEAWLLHPGPVSAREHRALRQLLVDRFAADRGDDQHGYGHLAGFTSRLDGEATQVRLASSAGQPYDHAGLVLGRLRDDLRRRAERAEAARQVDSHAVEAVARALADRGSVLAPPAPARQPLSDLAAPPPVAVAASDPAAAQHLIDQARSRFAAEARMELTLGVHRVTLKASERLDELARLHAAIRAAEERLTAPAAHVSLPQVVVSRQAARLELASLTAEHRRLAGEQLPLGGREAIVQAAGSAAERLAAAQDLAPPTRLRAEVDFERLRADVRRELHSVVLEQGRLERQLAQLERTAHRHPRPKAVARARARLERRARHLDTWGERLRPLLARLDGEALARDVERLGQRLLRDPGAELLDRYIAGRRRLEATSTPSLRRPSPPVAEVRHAFLAAPSPRELLKVDHAVAGEIAGVRAQANVELRAARGELSRAARDLHVRPDEEPARAWLFAALSRRDVAETAAAKLNPSPEPPAGGPDRLRSLASRLARGDRSPELVDQVRRELKAPPRPLPTQPETLSRQVGQARDDAAELARAARAVARSSPPSQEQVARLAHAAARSQASTAALHETHLRALGLLPPEAFAHGDRTRQAAAWSAAALKRLTAPAAAEHLRRAPVRPSFGLSDAATLIVGLVANHLARAARRELLEKLKGDHHHHER